MENDPENDASTAQKNSARKNKAGFVDWLVNQRQRFLKFTYRRLPKDRKGEASDIVQSMFGYVCSKSSSFFADVKSPTAWTHQTLRNKFYRAVGRRRHYSLHKDEVADWIDGNEAKKSSEATDERFERLQHAANYLSEGERQLLEMQREGKFESLTSEEIGERLGISAASYRKRLSRLRARLVEWCDILAIADDLGWDLENIHCQLLSERIFGNASVEEMAQKLGQPANVVEDRIRQMCAVLPKAIAREMK